MTAFGIIIGRVGYAEALAGELAKNVIVEFEATTEAEAKTKALEAFREEARYGDTCLNEDTAEVYAVEVWEDGVPEIVGWEVEADGTGWDVIEFLDAITELSGDS